MLMPDLLCLLPVKMHRVIYFYEYTCKNYQQCAIEGVFIFKSVWGSIYFHPMQCVYQTIHLHHHQLKLSDCRRLPVSVIRGVDDSLHREVYGSRICDIWSWWLPSWVTWGVAITIYFFFTHCIADTWSQFLITHNFMNLKPKLERLY